MNIRMTQLLLILSLLSGCVATNVVTKEEIETQNKVDAVVSKTLFDKELDDATSYNVRKNGFVVIKFDESVSEHAYTDVVNLLRASPEISGVRAEQSGKEVCPFR